MRSVRGELATKLGERVRTSCGLFKIPDEVARAVHAVDQGVSCNAHTLATMNGMAAPGTLEIPYGTDQRRNSVDELPQRLITRSTERVPPTSSSMR